MPSGADTRRAVPLRRRLLLLAAGAVLPLALMTGVALQALLQQQQAQIEQSSLDLSRALATAVDTELRLTISTLQTLAAEPAALWIVGLEALSIGDADELRELVVQRSAPVIAIGAPSPPLADAPFACVLEANLTSKQLKRAVRDVLASPL